MALVCAFTLATSAFAAEAPPRHELIVLLDFATAAPRPEAVVDAARRGDPLPAGLGVGGPSAADFVIPRRASGEAAERHRLDPLSPSAKLQRYLVLTYPATADLEAIEQALERNPHVVWVGPVRTARVSATEPNDPRFDDDPGGVPRPADEHQWGSYALSLPEAWDYAKGHAYVGILDIGIDEDHEDLRAFDGSGNFVGGNYRSHWSWDYETDTATVDDNDPVNNHGTHVAGIVGATTNNGTGVAGACWHCSVVMSQVGTGSIDDPVLVAGIEGSVELGMQVLNMSFGYQPDHNPPPPDCAVEPNDVVCVALQLAEDREVLIAAASGNNDLPTADWPSTDPRVLGVGGTESNGSFWREGCQETQVGDEGCGANADPDQLVAPAKEVLSTFYLTHPYNVSAGCSDSVDGTVDGYGPCTGTSMSSPYIAASAGILRSVNPLLTVDQIRTLLVDSVETPAGWDPADGIGQPNLFEAVQDALGRVGGQVIDNRLTPLLRMYSSAAEDHFYTSAPQMAAAKHESALAYTTYGAPDVPGYGRLPGTNCTVGPCSDEMRAEVYVFSGDRSPNGHPLVPLYRLSYEPPDPVPATPENEDDNRDHTYTTEAAGIGAFAGVGYELDGIEGYIYELCSPEPSCIPSGAVRLYRYYNASRDDWAIFPESELASYQAQGYSAQTCCNDWIGYVYENVDTDGDTVIDGFESLIGTDPNVADSDGDGVSDGAEIVQFPYSDPLPQPIGEFGLIKQTFLSSNPRTITFSRSYQNPVVFALTPSVGGADTVVARITSVGSNSFTAYLQEPPDRDGNHTYEQVGWLVLEAGSWELEDGTRLEVGTVETDTTHGRNVVGAARDHVPYPTSFTAVPTVLTQVQTVNDASFVKSKQHFLGTNGFRVALEPEEAQTTYHGTETIAWMAIENGTGTWSGHTYEVGVTPNLVTDAWYTHAFSQSFTEPRLYATFATTNGGDNFAIRYTNLGSGSVDFKAEEDTTYDAETGHVEEIVNYLVLEGSGTLEAVPFP